MTKRTNKYKLTLEQLSSMKEGTALPDAMSVDFENHDDVFRIVGIMREKNLFGDDEQSAQFAIGLKLFSGVLVKNKAHPLFAEFFPSFVELMKKIKED